MKSRPLAQVWHTLSGCTLRSASRGGDKKLPCPRTGNANEPSKRGFLEGGIFSVNKLERQTRYARFYCFKIQPRCAYYCTSGFFQWEFNWFHSTAPSDYHIFRGTYAAGEQRRMSLWYDFYLVTTVPPSSHNKICVVVLQCDTTAGGDKSKRRKAARDMRVSWASTQWGRAPITKSKRG